MLDYFRKKEPKIKTTINLSKELKEWANEEDLNLSFVLEEKLIELKALPKPQVKKKEIINPNDPDWAKKDLSNSIETDKGAENNE